jgi:hypothetical protein
MIDVTPGFVAIVVYKEKFQRHQSNSETNPSARCAY